MDKNNPTSVGDPEDQGDGIMDMMLKPTLTTYESRNGKKNKEEEEEDEDE